ncbi:MAG: hypothetical protein WA902_24560 [Thermosynechococcaceae cyanobacterium]
MTVLIGAIALALAVFILKPSVQRNPVETEPQTGTELNADQAPQTPTR